MISVSITPSSGDIIPFDDTTPPVTAHTLDPPEPDGLNGWYVSDLNVTLNATDDMSGVKEIGYEVNGVPGTIKGDNGTFTITTDGDDILVEYWAFDNAGNIEPRNSFTIDMDQTKPSIDLTYHEESGEIIFNASTYESTSGMNRVEFVYLNDILEIVYGEGPVYLWKWNETNVSDYRTYYAFGLILNPRLIDQNITFFAIIVIVTGGSWIEPFYTYVVGYDNAGNWEEDHLEFPSLNRNKLYILQWVTLPKYSDGYLGKFFVNAFFQNWE